MLSPSEIQSFYSDSLLQMPKRWKLTRKHFRAALHNGRFVRLNRFRNRINLKDLQYCCWKLKPLHVYFSVLNWLFPERVGKKYKAKYCVPLNGEYVVDVDSYMMFFKHEHRIDPEWRVCPECLGMSKRLTLQVCEAIENYYSKLAVVFSGRAGFHIHVLGFNYKDWVSYRERTPIWCYQTSRFKFTRLLQKQTFVFNLAHFIVSVDPMRVVTVPNTLNGKTGLICKYIGDRKDLERLGIHDLLGESMAFSKFDGYPEPLESSIEKARVQTPPKNKSSNGTVKQCAKNQSGGNMVRVTTMTPPLIREGSS